MSSTSEFTIFLQTPPRLAGAVTLTLAPGPCLCSPVEADLIETLFAGLVYGVEAGARVLFLMAVWAIGRIRLGAAAWGTGLAGQGAAPNLVHWRLALISGSGYALYRWPSLDTLIHTYTPNTHPCGIDGPFGTAQCYAMHLQTYKFTTTLRSIFSNTDPHVQAGSQKATPASQEHTNTLSSRG